MWTEHLQRRSGATPLSQGPELSTSSCRRVQCSPPLKMAKCVVLVVRSSECLCYWGNESAVRLVLDASRSFSIQGLLEGPSSLCTSVGSV